MVSEPLQSASGVYVNVSPLTDVVPFEASVTIEYVSASPSTSVAEKSISTAVFAVVEPDTSTETGASLTGLIIIVAVEVLLSSVPSFTLKVNVSVPFQSASGVYKF